MKRLVVPVATLAIALTLGAPLATAAATPVAPAPPNYLAVGDSVTQGLGVKPSQSYPRLLDRKSPRVTLAANLGASGATLETVAAQLAGFAGANPAAAAGIRTVSMTVGANDAAWVLALMYCLNLPADIACADRTVDEPGLPQLPLQQLVDLGLAGLAANLPVLLDTAGTMYPNATIYVGSYYELFGSRHRACVVPSAPGSIPPAYTISLRNKTWYNQTTRRLNAVIRAAVAAANATPDGGKVRFVNVARAFDGHGFCDWGRRWLIGPKETGGAFAAVAHPNAKGQRAYAAAFRHRGIR